LTTDLDQFWFRPVQQPVRTTVFHGSGPIWVRSSLFEDLNLAGPVSVPVFGAEAQKLDWTGLSNTRRGAGEGIFRWSGFGGGGVQ